ncbi:MAG: hypothetical protein U0939_21060 [Pirellulales bacterium]
MSNSQHDQPNFSDDVLRRLLRQCEVERRVRAEDEPVSSQDELQTLLEQCVEGRADAAARARFEQLVGDSDIARLMFDACTGDQATPLRAAAGGAESSASRALVLPPPDLASLAATSGAGRVEEGPYNDWIDDDWEDEDDVDHAAVWAEVKEKLLRLNAVEAEAGTAAPSAPTVPKSAPATPSLPPRGMSRRTLGVVASLAAAAVVAVIAIPFLRERDPALASVVWNDSSALTSFPGSMTRGPQDAMSPGSEWTFVPRVGETDRHRWILQIEDAVYLVGRTEKGQPQESVKIGVGSYVGHSLYLLVVSADQPTKSLTLDPIGRPEMLASLLTVPEILELQDSANAADAASRARIESILNGALRSEFQDAPYSLEIYVYPYKRS